MLLSLKDIIDILSSNLCVKQHPVPENMAGALYCVDGISVSAEAIIDLLERRAESYKEESECISSSEGNQPPQSRDEA